MARFGIEWKSIEAASIYIAYCSMVCCGMIVGFAALPSSCTTAPWVKVAAPFVEARSELQAGLSNRMMKLEAGRDVNDVSGRILVWFVGISVAITAVGLMIYVLADRWPTARKIKCALKGKA